MSSATENFIIYEVTSVNPNIVKTEDYDTAGGTSVTIPDMMINGLRTYDVTEIGDFSFASDGLTSVDLPLSVTAIGQQAFVDNNLTNITIPNMVTDIGQGAFAINSLTTIVVPDSVTNLGDSAFENNNLTAATIPDALTSISNNLFTNNNLTSFNFSNNVSQIGIGAFQGNNLSSISFEENLGIIEAGAFADNNLTTVTFPSTVTLIGNVAFNNNPLATVTSLSVIPPIITTGGSGDTFGDRSNTDLFIPAGTTGPYVTDTGALWTGFQSVTELALGLSDTELEQQIQIVTGFDTLAIFYPSTLNFKEFRLYSLTGAKIVKHTSSLINTEMLSSGIYILQLQFLEGTIHKKVLIH